MKKLLTSILILAVGLSILSGAALAKDQFFNPAKRDASPQLVSLIGEAIGLTTGGIQSRSPQGDTYIVDQAEVVVSEGIAPNVQKPIQFEGSVAAVDRNDELFDVTLVGSDLSAFSVDSETVYQGGITSFADITSDMQVSITATQGADGSWRVLSVVNQSPVTQNTDRQTGTSSGEGSHGDEGEGHETPTAPKINVGGRVTSVGAASLTIQTQGGDPMTFAIGESTIISSYNGSHDSLDDIGVNFTVAVIYYEDQMQDGLRLAYRVVVSNEGIAFNAHQQGWVTAVGGSSFTITTNAGAAYTFNFNGSSQIRGVGSFAELATGMRAFVYYTDDGGTLTAKGVQVWP